LDWVNLTAVLYPWLKAAHIIFVIFWIAGLFLLPRYYVYHQEAAQGSAEEARWVDREAKLRKVILTPAMAAVWVLGLLLAYLGPDLSADQFTWFSYGWLHAKLFFVLLLSAYHGYMVGYGRKLAAGKRPVSGKALRIMNEVPGVAAAIIVVLVVVKPF
jgi:putative membrane protein